MLWLTLSACSVDDRLPLQIPIRAGGTGVDSLTTVDGGILALTRATVTFADLRLEEPAGDDTTAASLIERLWPIPSAYAHPGHDYPGAVGAELLGTYTVDLLADDVELGVADGYEGELATGRVTVAGTMASFAGTHTTAGGTAVPFDFEVVADQDIIGIPFQETLSASSPPTSVDLRFDLEHALSFVDWTAADSDGDGVLTVADDIYGNTVLFGAVATPSWTLTLVP